MDSLTMKSTTISWLSIAALLLLSGIAWAQTACPPGMIPYGVGVCGYDDSRQQQQQQQQNYQSSQSRPVIWVDHWGAIATAEAQGVIGVATNRTNEADAVQFALFDCRSNGGVNCRVGLSYRNQCIAMVGAHLGYGMDVGPTPATASDKSLKKCTDGGFTNCHVIYTDCSLPDQIQ